MVLNLLDLQQVTVEHAMIPKNDVEGIDINDSEENINKKLIIKLSKKVPLFKAEIIPKINPKIVAIKIEEIAKTTVFGKVSLIIVETFTPLR